MFTLVNVLERAGIAVTDVNVMLHSPREAVLQSVLPSLVRTRRAAMEAYQATHTGRAAQRALRQRRPFVAAFVKVGQDVPRSHSKMLFAGLYRNAGNRPRSHADIMSDPEIGFLSRTYGTHPEFDPEDANRTHDWFDLTLDPLLTEMQGRLVISVRLTPNYIRLAENLDAPIRAIHEESAFDADPPDWRNWAVTAAELRALPPGWAARLREWRGIYLIHDASDGARYVGSAYGQTNLLGRWSAHVAGDEGVTVELARRTPATFMFSILERVSPDMPVEEITALEQGWMTRLHTKRDGLNR
ncbi:MAG: GIY-YIG nuclease family protein [Jannaschia sp.]